MHGTNLMAFKTDLRNVNWNSINHSSETNSKDKTLKIFSELYEKHFQGFHFHLKGFQKIFFTLKDFTFTLKDFQIKVKDLQEPWISKGLKKSSKQKQKL